MSDAADRPRRRRRRLPRTLRGRLVGAAAVAVLVSLFALGAVATLVVERQLRDGVDRELRARAVDVAQLVATTPALVGTRGALDLGSGGRQVWVQVHDRRGRMLSEGRSVSLGFRVLPRTAAFDRALRDGRAGYADARLGGEPIRTYAVPLTTSGRRASGGVVVVASSVADIEDTFASLRRVIAIAALVAAALGGLLAAVLTSAGLRPLRRLARGARAIAEDPVPGRRLEAGPGGDELTALAETLNGMLDALDRARAAERRLLADASHELRTPVTALRGNAAYAARHGADAEVLRELEADAERLALLVDDLLALEREEGAARPAERVLLADVVAAVVGAAPGPELTVEVDPALAVRGQAGALERALRNLVENARRHGPAGGRVTIVAAADGDRARLSVRDEGAGIAPEQAAQALRRFWRGPDATAARRPGSGLGLAIVAATAARHGGSVRIDAATITIELPREP
ncbi:sensor histidine kinase [Patulibacter defluvii]|uniref:sensor histidine kinase n=1 Tax=Patulibacter defluvii TaxID=3095358 RepID=UPI002A75B4B0|nr:HAMP domain-containing sensor histidine kinase [Patulibacter sp. DM4]